MRPNHPTNLVAVMLMPMCFLLAGCPDMTGGRGNRNTPGNLNAVAGNMNGNENRNANSPNGNANNNENQNVPANTNANDNTNTNSNNANFINENAGNVNAAPNSNVNSAGLPCQPQSAIPAALLSCRNWITFAPPHPFNPETGTFPSELQLRAALQLLFDEGWRGLVTYSLDGTLREVPRIAKEVGFEVVVPGLFWFDQAQLARERAAALEEVAFIDAFVLGNEGLTFGRYPRAQLESELASLQAETGLPVTTTEPAQRYLDDPTLLDLGDWVFPNLHAWFAGIRTVPEAVAFVESQYEQLKAAAPGRPLILKESWWPTAGGEGSSEANQVEYFRQLAQTSVKFVWGEAFDQFWKDEEGRQGPHWGFHTDMSAPKPLISELAQQYVAAYPE